MNCETNPCQIASGNANGIDLARGQHGSKSNQLLGNTVRNNKQSGIVVESAGNRLRGNTAVGNREHGIDASGGTIDGGGNRARGNRLAPQCIGIACS